jgi:hypothetical protein
MENLLYTSDISRTLLVGFLTMLPKRDERFQDGVNKEYSFGLELL